MTLSRIFAFAHCSPLRVAEATGFKREGRPTIGPGNRRPAVPWTFLIRRFGSLFGRINSLFGYLGKSTRNPLNYCALRRCDHEFSTAEISNSQFFPADQGTGPQRSQLSSREWPAGSTSHPLHRPVSALGERMIKGMTMRACVVGATGCFVRRGTSDSVHDVNLASCFAMIGRP
jgi:hypothetical protein